MTYYFLTAVYNRTQLTLECLNTISDQMGKLAKSYRILVIEAGDDEPLLEGLSAELEKHVDVMKVPESTYWTSGMSIGVDYLMQRTSDEDVFIFFNNDIVIPDGAIKKMITYDFSSNIAVSPASISAHDNKSVATGVSVKSWLLCFHQTEYINLTIEQLKNHRDISVDFMTQRFLWLGRHVIDKVGNYRADLLPHYGGDYELTARMNRLGVKVLLTPRCHIYIDEKNTGLNSRFRKLMFRERVQSLFVIKSSSNLWTAAKFSYLAAPIWSQPINIILMVTKAFLRALILTPRRK